MDEGVRQQVIDDIWNSEATICGEWHGDHWPACDENHRPGDELLARLGANRLTAATPADSEATPT